MSNGDPIIIKGGGSIAIQFNGTTYTGADGRYYSAHSKIVSVEITDDETGQTQTVEVPVSGKCTVKINTH
jgi:hypothetical protein